MRSKYPAAWERTSVDPSSRQLNEATKLLVRYALSALPDWDWFAEPVDFITDAIMADTCEPPPQRQKERGVRSLEFGRNESKECCPFSTC
ncbi:hypothetical protein EV1_038685 [Malus domestica]